MQGNKVKLEAKNVEIYKMLRVVLDKNKIARHTYSLEEEKTFRVVLKHMHHSTNIELIKQALLKEGHDVVNIMNVINRETKQKKNLFFIDIKRDTNNKGIFKIKNIENTIIEIEGPIKKVQIPQCKNCQCYGHTRNTRPARCVKCAELHDYRKCTKNRNDGEPAKCVLCNGAHPANYKGCKVYLDILCRRYPSQAGKAYFLRNQPHLEKYITQPSVPQNQTVQKQDLSQQQTKLTMKNNSHTPQNTVSSITYPTFVQITASSQSHQIKNQCSAQQGGDLTSIIISLQQTIQTQQQTINELTTQIRLLREELFKNKNGANV